VRERGRPRAEWAAAFAAAAHDDAVAHEVAPQLLLDHGDRRVGKGDVENAAAHGAHEVIVRLGASIENDLAAVGRSETDLSALDHAGRDAVQRGQSELRQLVGDRLMQLEVGRVPELAQRGVNELHVEAGHKLNGSLIREGLVDELLVYLAPMLIGPGREMAALAPLDRLVSASEFEFHDMCRIGADIRILARPPGRAEF